MAEVAELKLHKVIGYNGSFNNTVLYTKDGHYLIYSLGLTVVIRDLRSNAQGFLHGHTDIITCLTLSNNGRLLASGQQSKSRGNKAPVLVWDLQAAIAAMASKANQSDKVTYRLVLHMGKVQDMAFSSQDNCLFTVGGQDDNALVCWNMETGEPICGTPAGDDSTLVVRAFRQASNNELLVTGGNYAFNVWRVDHKHRKFHPLRANLGNLKRIMSAIAISPDDKIAYVGTKTGDVLEIILDCDLTKPNCAFPPVGTQKPRYNRTTKERFSQGINTVAVVEQNQQRMLLLGAGDGSIAMLLTGGVADGIKSTPIPTGPIEKLQGGVTAVAEGPPGVYFIGTNQSNMYAATVDSSAIKVELRATCHYGSINDIVFPKAPSKGDDINSNLFVTCSKTDIRIWNARKAQEILRIQVPNLVCNCVDLTVDGSVIVSGWDDGKVRAFYPESGKLKFVIQDAHNESVTAIAVCNDTDKEWRLITGGKDGRVRVWRITPSRQTMEASMKEHRGPVNSIQVVQDNSSCVSASSDGQDNIYSCISWNLESFTRVQAMFASTVFRRILYHPDESQMLTCGSDRRVTYYDSYDGEAIRILEEAAEGELLALDIERSGNLFVTGGRDSTLKVWHYDNGEPIALGKGHSEAINAVKISPDRKHIVTVGSEGAIMIWEVGNLLVHLDN